MKVNVCIVTFPLSEAGYTPLSNLVKLFSALANRVYVVSGGEALTKLENLKSDVNVYTIKVTHRVSLKLLMRIINYVHTQLKILQGVIEALGGADLFVFSIGGEDLILPILALKLLRKKVLLMPGGVVTKVYSVRTDPLSKFLSFLVSIDFSLADKIILYSQMLAQESDFSRFPRKTVIAHEHFVDFTKFTLRKKFDERLNIVGYVGRLSEEKGILNLVDAIPSILNVRMGICFAIYGEGNLADEIKKIIHADGLESIVRLTEWVPHEDVPRYLNDLKLLVLPSFTEGLPNILLEAMACGTPILATSVGAIPDIIKDGETGFLLKSNDPKHIADKIAKLFKEQQLLEEVSQNASKWVRENFSKEETIRIWQRILGQLEIC
jgi:glycosyltransferase involved in cell wall biosynthesis